MSKSTKKNSTKPLIHTHKSLYAHLQAALAVELFTIPPYLCALWSLEDGSNPEAHEVIRSVVMEEMLHMTLVANLMNAIKAPDFDRIRVHSRKDPKIMYPYPHKLPQSNPKDHRLINLEKFSPDAIDAFMEIENPREPGAPPEDGKFDTIGQFYEAVAEGFIYLAGPPDKNGKPKNEDKLFVGNKEHQIPPKQYYGSGGFVFSIWNLEYALKAIHEISEQGEGYIPESKRTKDGEAVAVHDLGGAIWDGDDHFGQAPQPAHFYRFQEIKMGQKYKKGDIPYDPCNPDNSGPTGAKFQVDWNKVHNMQRNPKSERYATGSPIWQKMNAFNQRFNSMLIKIEEAFNGQPHMLQEAVAEMYKLKYLGKELMRIPSGEGNSTVGPSFEYLPKSKL